MNNLNIGFIGIGLMGLSLVKRLSYLDYKIEAYDKNLEKLDPLKNMSNIKLFEKTYHNNGVVRTPSKRFTFLVSPVKFR